MEWFNYICLYSKKKLEYDSYNIIGELKEPKIRYILSKLLSQNYKTLLDIDLKDQKFLGNESFLELLKKLKIVLSFISLEEFKTCKLITLSMFKYYSYFDELKKTKTYLYTKYNELYTPCSLWVIQNFWKKWLDQDINYIEKSLNISKDNYCEFESIDSSKNNYEKQINNGHSLEYCLLVKLYRLMVSLKLNEQFIRVIIFQNFAFEYLTDYEISMLKTELQEK